MNVPPLERPLNDSTWSVVARVGRRRILFRRYNCESFGGRRRTGRELGISARGTFFHSRCLTFLWRSLPSFLRRRPLDDAADLTQRREEVSRVHASRSASAKKRSPRSCVHCADRDFVADGGCAARSAFGTRKLLRMCLEIRSTDAELRNRKLEDVSSPKTCLCSRLALPL